MCHQYFKSYYTAVACSLFCDVILYVLSLFYSLVHAASPFFFVDTRARVAKVVTVHDDLLTQ